MTGKRFFIQARLIFHVMDTKALEPVLNMESMTTSRYGCPYCRNAHGQQNSWKVIFTGNRNTLPIYHYLRYFGQTGKCCQHGYYEPDGKYFNEEVFINDHTPISAASLTKKNDMGFVCPVTTILIVMSKSRTSYWTTKVGTLGIISRVRVLILKISLKVKMESKM